MDNEMELFGGSNVLNEIERLPDHVKEAIRHELNTRAIESAINSIKNEMEANRHDLDRLRAESEQRFVQLGDSVKGAIDASAIRYKDADKYYTRSVLGDLYSPAISAKRMSKLMIVIGVLTDRDTPRHEYQKGESPLAKRKPFADYPTWVFHIGKVQNLTDGWLTEHGLFEDFHETSTKNQRDKFIDMLFEEHT